MLGTETSLAVFYLGFGYVIFLGWAPIAHALNKSVAPATRSRFRRLAVALAVAGLVHPAFALVGRDVAGQLGGADHLTDPIAGRVLQITNWSVVAAFGIAVLVIASHLERFRDVSLLRVIRDGLPFA